MGFCCSRQRGKHSAESFPGKRISLPPRSCRRELLPVTNRYLRNEGEIYSSNLGGTAELIIRPMGTDDFIFRRRIFLRLLLIHADKFSFLVTEKTSAVSSFDKLSANEDRGEAKELLVAFVSVENGDELDISGIAQQATEQIKDLLAKLKVERVMVYPYAHLSSNLAKPKIATQILSEIAANLRQGSGIEVLEAPFGYYKAFDISCKGHPLSELSLTITPGLLKQRQDKEDVVPDASAEANEKKLKSEWRIYFPEGTFVPANEFDFSANSGLKDLMAYEAEGTRKASEAPVHIKIMREHELVDHEPASDTGNLRWYPKGLTMKRLLERHVSDIASDYGAMEVETPIMYDYDHPALSEYLQRFPARQYVVKSDDKEYFLRFAACFGQYMLKHDMVISYKNLPLSLYELTHYSFRREQSGEVAGLRRLRTFTMPDMHTVVRDMKMATTEFVQQIDLCLSWLDDLELECVPVIRFVSSFLEENPEIIKEIMKKLNRPALVEIWDQRFFYFVAKFELNFVDTSKKAACLSTVQIDVENAERFDINYIDEDGSKKQPYILHASISGSIDRNIYAILEKQAMRIESGEKPLYPLWLSPIHVRVLPVSEKHVEKALQIAEQIPLRTDVDDRNLRIGKKIREAEKEWVPFIIVVGDRELEGTALPIRPRIGDQENLTLTAFVSRLIKETSGMPMMSINTPRLLSKRPTFGG